MLLPGRAAYAVVGAAVQAVKSPARCLPPAMAVLSILPIPESGCFGLCVDSCICNQFRKWCQRSFGTPHPFPHASGTLPRPGGKGLGCSHCRNAVAWKNKGLTPEQRAERLKEAEEPGPKRKAHQSDVAEWEKIIIENGGQRVPRSKATVTIEDSLPAWARGAP